MDDPVRDVTEEEIAFFREKGWVLLPSLVEPDIVPELYATALACVEEQRSGYPVYGTSRDVNTAELFGRIDDMADRNALYAALVDSRVFSRNASRMLMGDRPMRRQGNGTVLVKEPVGSDRGHGPTHFHQDCAVFPYDRTWVVNSWTALHELTPEMGTLQFFSGSHEYGLLGRGYVPAPDAEAIDMLRSEEDRAGNGSAKEFHPWLRMLEVTDPPHMQPGDTLMWHGLTLHGAPPNRSGEARLTFTNLRFDAETLYTGAQSPSVDKLGLRPNEPFDHPKYPLTPF